MDETTIPSGGDTAAAPVEYTPMSADDGDRAIEKILSGDAPSKEDNVAEGEAQQPPSAEASKEEDEPLVITAEDDEPQQTAQAPAQPVEPGDDTLVTLSDGQKIPLGELKKDPFLRRDYTFKTEALKKQASEFETWQKTEVEKLQHNRNLVLSYMQKHMPPRPDRTLVNPQNPDYDPLKYQQQQVEYEMAMEEFQTLDQQRQADEQRKQSEEQEFQRQYEAKAAETRKQELERFYLALPKYRDQAKREAFFADVRTIVPQVYGLNADEILSLENSGAMRMVHDAIQYRKALAESKKVKQELPAAPKLLGKQRATPQSDQQRDSTGRFASLRKSGSVEAADLAIEAILSRN